MKISVYLLIICLLLIHCSEIEMKWATRLDITEPGVCHVNDVLSFGKKGLGITGFHETEGEEKSCVTAWFDEQGTMRWFKLYERPHYKETIGKTIKYTWVFQELIEKEKNLYVHIQATDFRGYRTSILVKYDTLGNLLWEKTIEQSDDETELKSTMLIDYRNNLYIAGLREKDNGVQNIFITKYDESGDEVWSIDYYNPDLLTPDIAFDVTEPDNIVASGVLSSSNDVFYMRYDDRGELNKMKVIHTPEQELCVADLKVDPRGVVYLLAVSEMEFKDDYCTILCSAGDSIMWVKHFDGPAHGNDIPVSITYGKTSDTLGVYMGVYVTGQSENERGTSDIVTVKYDSEGTEVWTRRFVGRTDESVVPLDIQSSTSTSHEHAVYITGYVGDDALFLKYNARGFLIWFTRYGKRRAVCRPTAHSGMVWAVESQTEDTRATFLLKYGKVEYLSLPRWD